MGHRPISPLLLHAADVAATPKHCSIGGTYKHTHLPHQRAMKQTRDTAHESARANLLWS